MINEVVKKLICALEDAGIEYMVVGSYSSNYYGVPRSTKDLDLVVELSGKAISDLASRLGPEFAVDPQSTFETATFSIKNVIRRKDSAFEIELFHLRDDEHDQMRFHRRVQIHFSDCAPFLRRLKTLLLLNFAGYWNSIATRTASTFSM